MKKSIQEIRAEAELPLDLSQLPIRVTLDIPYCIDGNPAHTLDIALSGTFSRSGIHPWRRFLLRLQA